MQRQKKTFVNSVLIKKLKASYFFFSVFKDADSLSEKVKTQLLPPRDKQTGQKAEMKSRRQEEEEQRRRGEDSDPLRIPNRHPGQRAPPHWLVMTGSCQHVCPSVCPQARNLLFTLKVIRLLTERDGQETSGDQ